MKTFNKTTLKGYCDISGSKLASRTQKEKKYTEKYYYS